MSEQRPHLANWNFSYLLQCLLLEVLCVPQGAFPQKESTANNSEFMVCVKEINLFSLILGLKVQCALQFQIFKKEWRDTRKHVCALAICQVRLHK